MSVFTILPAKRTRLLVGFLCSFFTFAWPKSSSAFYMPYTFRRWALCGPRPTRRQTPSSKKMLNTDWTHRGRVSGWGKRTRAGARAMTCDDPCMKIKILVIEHWKLSEIVSYADYSSLGTDALVNFTAFLTAEETPFLKKKVQTHYYCLQILYENSL